MLVAIDYLYSSLFENIVAKIGTKVATNGASTLLYSNFV